MESRSSSKGLAASKSGTMGREQFSLERVMVIRR